jgi:hypothetical protein
MEVSARPFFQIFFGRVTAVVATRLRQCTGRETPGTEKGDDDMAGYSVQINYNQTTQQALQGTYTLFGFKAVKSGTKGGAPVVWFADSSFLAAGVNLTWTETYQAFISTSLIIPNGQIVTSASINADLGDTVTVDASGNLSAATGGPDASGITIVNGGSTPYTCGVSQLQGGSMVPLCGFPLHGNQADDIEPIEKVLLFFGTTPLNTGTVIETTASQGVMIDLITANKQNVSVTYDIDKGWDAKNANWATLISAATTIGPLLILRSDSASTRRRVG